MSDFVKRISRLAARRWVVLGAIFLVLAAVRVSAVYNHDELIADETFSLMLAQHNPAYVSPLPADTVLTGRQIQDMLVARHPLADDLSALYVNNSDIPHASLYYMALRLCVGGMTEYSATGLARRGGWLNMLFFAVSFYAFCRLLRLIFGSSRNLTALMAVGASAAFAGSCAVDCTMLVREYQMAQMMIVLACWAAASIAVRLRQGRKPRLLQWAGLVAATAGALSTGYLNALMIALVFGWLVVAAFVYRRYGEAMLCIAAGAASLVMAWLMYVGFFNFLLHSTIHTEYAFRQSAVLGTLVFVDCIRDGMFTLPGLVFMGLMLVFALTGKRRRQLVTPEHMPWLPLMALAAMLLTEYASVLHALRYVYPLIPVLALVVPLILAALPGRFAALSASAVMSLWLIGVAVFVPVRKSYDWARIAGVLHDGATLYDLNANELPQIAPMVNPEAVYHLTDSVPTDRTRPVISRVVPQGGGLTKSGELTGPLKVYRFAE